jgi:hypothetical protein
MSERANRKKCAASLSKRIATLKAIEADQAELLAALELAHTALCEEPRALTSCGIEVESMMFQTMLERAHCTECKSTLLGYSEAWRHCPVCGSQIHRVARDSDPFDRNIRERIDSNFTLKEQ